MPIRSFPTSLRAHRNATAEIKKDGEAKEEKQGFLVHGFLRAQGVRGRSRTGTCEYLEQLADAVERAEINVVRTAPQQLLRH